jgi:radical SAM superfamily enzyme YgiQ (UPF0313 family)
LGEAAQRTLLGDQQNLGGREGWIAPDVHPRYAEIFTSRGCPFSCSYCHISKERGNDVAGDIGALRFHSLERVERELQYLKSLTVDHLFINDDSFLAKKILALFEVFFTADRMVYLLEVATDAVSAILGVEQNCDESAVTV